MVLFVACRRLAEAEGLASARIAQVKEATPVDRLAVARATRGLADVLLEAGKTREAAPHVLEARRLYRPFRNDAALSAEVDLTLAQLAAHDDRSLEAEQILSEATAATRDVAGAEVPYARLLRYSAHLQVIRAEFERGDGLIGEALSAVRRAAAGGGGEVSLLLSQYLFTQGEVAFMREDAERARGSTAAALDVAEMDLRGAPEYVLFARARAAHACRVFGDTAKAEELEARAEGRHG